MGILYRLNFSSGKSYIGQTVKTMRFRLNQHRTASKRGSLLAVHCAWRKHGEPSVEILGDNIKNGEDLHLAEIEAIKNFNTISPNGYNLSFGGDTAPALSPLVSEKIRQKAIGRKVNNSVRRSEIATGLWLSSEYREKMSVSLKKSWTKEKSEKTSAKFKKMWEQRKNSGWVMPESTKQKLASRKVSDNTRKLQSLAKAGKPGRMQTQKEKDEAKERMRLFWSNPENKAKRLASIEAGRAEKKAVELSNTFTTNQTI